MSLAPATDAATVVLLRDGLDGLEVFLMRRTSSMRFAPGMHVFPGGRVDSRDFAPVPLLGAIDARGAGWDAALARALVVCAIRETFEETGVLLGSGRACASADRADVEAGGDFGGALTTVGITLHSDALAMWSHWVTPEIEPKRFDVRFFVAELPAGQQVGEISGEADDALWVRPQDALAEHSRGRLPMLPPTSATLEELASIGSAQEALGIARERKIEPYLPHRGDDGSWSIIHAYDRSVIHPVTEARVVAEVEGIRDLGGAAASTAPFTAEGTRGEEDTAR